MEQINLDSDCEIQNSSTITIADSQTDEEEIEDGGVVVLDESNAGDAIEIDDDDADIEEVEDGEIDSNSIVVLEEEEDETTQETLATQEAPETTAEEPAELFTVTFAHKQVFQRLGHKILSALQAALTTELNANIQTVALDKNTICLKAFATAAEAVTTDGAAQSTAPAEETTVAAIPSENDIKAHDKRAAKEQSPDLSDLSTLFMIDTAPSLKLDSIKVPSYKRAIKDVLNEESSQKKKKNDEDVCRRVRPNASCFNCGSTEHAIRECPKPRNMQRINRAKKAFSANKTDRYHVDVEQRFAHLRPGGLSDKLQAALGLRRGELPFFYYRMRVLGYPPGWLEDAKVADSGITLFNSEGNPVAEANAEEGLVDSPDHKYDISKIVGFPGFNVDPGKDFYDDYKYHNVPPMQKQQLKPAFIKTLGDNVIKGYKRKKLLEPAGAAEPATIDNGSNLDMDIDDAEPNDSLVEFSRPPPPTTAPEVDTPPPPPPPETPPPAERAAHKRRSQSPTLEDLQAEQLKLLQELQANTSLQTEPADDSLVIEPADDSLIDEVLALDDSQSQLSGSEDSAAVAPTTPQTPQPAEALDVDKNVAAITAADVIKESHIGTPILKFSPFDKLPTGDKFKVGVSDVINFENLPDSTGKYEQMKLVIKKVRNVITRLINEDD